LSVKAESVKARLNLPSGILSQSRIIIVDDTGFWVKDDILKNGTKLDGIENVGFLFRGQTDALGVALRRS